MSQDYPNPDYPTQPEPLDLPNLKAQLILSPDTYTGTKRLSLQFSVRLPGYLPLGPDFESGVPLTLNPEDTQHLAK